MDDEWRKGFNDGFRARVRRDQRRLVEILRYVMDTDLMRLRILAMNPRISVRKVDAVLTEHHHYPRGFMAGWDSRLVRDL